MRATKILLATTLLGATPLLAQAQPFQGVYIGAGAGANFPEPLTDTRPHGVYRYLDTGFTGLASVGYGFGNGLRLELEGNYRENTDRHIIYRTFKDRRYGGLANAFFDIDVGSPYVFPYLGAGLGGVITELGHDNVSYQQSNLAYQAIAGSSFPIPGVPGLSLTAEYRFLGENGVQKKTEITHTSFLGSDMTPIAYAYNTTPFRLRQQYDHSLMVGVRYAFGVQPPTAAAAVTPPVVAPMPATSRTYLVFFDWDRADLSDRARQIVAQAAQNARAAPITRLEVDGYTDTSGTAAYNQRLSIRRAQAVAAELVRDGVARSSIAVQGMGENNLLVPTADGVREPQNRRVEIILR